MSKQEEKLTKDIRRANAFRPPEKEDDVICERYIAFSSELLKFAGLSIGAIWAMISVIYKVKDGLVKISECDIPILSWAIGLLVASAGFSLAHRYVASNSMTNFRDAKSKHDKLPKPLPQEGMSEEVKSDLSKFINASNTFRMELKLSTWAIGLAAFFLFSGICVTGYFILHFHG